MQRSVPPRRGTTPGSPPQGAGTAPRSVEPREGIIAIWFERLADARGGVPTGESSRTRLKTEDVLLVADRDCAAKFSLNRNVGVPRYDRAEGNTFVATLAAVTLNVQPSDRVKPFVDVGYQAAWAGFSIGSSSHDPILNGTPRIRVRSSRNGSIPAVRCDRDDASPALVMWQ